MTVITETTIKELASFKSADTPVVSCYLDVDGRRHIRPKDYQLELESLKKQLLATHPGQTFDADFALTSQRISIAMVFAALQCFHVQRRSTGK
jgi:hypothetical protein